jgi:hypothetical protein
METKIKIITAALIPYFFLCAGLYNIAFWSPFGVNAFSFLDVADIIKSAIVPFFYTSFSSLFLLIFQYSGMYNILPYGGGNTKPPKLLKKIIWALLNSVYYGLVIYLIAIHTDKWKGLYLPWILAIGAFHTFSEYLLKKQIIEHSKTSFLLIYVIILLPVFCYTSGTVNAEQIYENKKCEITNNIIPGIPLKFLGKASDHYIFVSVNNLEKYIFSTSEIKGLKLIEFSAKK